MPKQLNLIRCTALLLCTVSSFSQSWQWARKGGILRLILVFLLTVVPKAATAQEILKILGQDTVCPATVYRFTATKLPGKQLYWQAIGGRIAENNPSDSITVSFDPARNNYALKVLYRTEGNMQPGDSVYKKLSIPSAAFSIEGILPNDAVVAGSYTSFRATTADAMLYSWKIIPTSAGTILLNGSREIKILWHETTVKQQLRISATALICGSAFTSHRDVELLPSTHPEIKKQKGIKPDASFIFTDFPCKDSPVAFKALHPKNGYHYDWEFGGIHNSNPEPCFSFRESGTQAVKLSITDDDGNTGISVKYLTVVDNALDGYLISVPKNDGKSALLQFLVSPEGNAPEHYIWMKGNKPAGQSETNGFTVRESGDYWVKVTDKNGCMKDILPPRQVILYKDNFKKTPN